MDYGAKKLSIFFSFSGIWKIDAACNVRKGDEPVGQSAGSYSLLPENWRKSSLSQCSQKFAIGGRCWITYGMRVQSGSWPCCSNVLRVIWSVLRFRTERNPYFCFLPQCFGSLLVSFFCSHYCCFGGGVSWTMRSSSVFIILADWQVSLGARLGEESQWFLTVHFSTKSDNV